MTNVFITPEQIRSDRLIITGEDAMHLAGVLRLVPGDYFSALDGTGMQYKARIVSSRPDEVIGVIEERGMRATEPRLRLTLGQALPKADRMEQLIKQGTELGMASFQPLLTERCIARPKDSGASAREARWQRIALEAARQSGRAVVPQVQPVCKWREIADSFPRYGLVLLAWENERVNDLKRILAGYPEPSQIMILIGPEGGLTLREAQTAREAGAIPVSLGPRILRTETAGLVLGSAIFYHYDELGVRA